MVVIMVTPLRMAAARILPSSVPAPLRVGVLMIIASSPFLIRSRALGRPPSWILRIAVVVMPSAASVSWVPRVVTTSKPCSTSPRAISVTWGLSFARTLRNTLPSVGSGALALICDLAKATAKSGSAPMHSPVLRISGPKITSTPGNLPKGKTDSLTEVCLGVTSSVTPSSLSCLPIITLAATRAQLTPVALPTKGTVREARGFTSIT